MKQKNKGRKSLNNLNSEIHASGMNGVEEKHGEGEPDVLNEEGYDTS